MFKAIYRFCVGACEQGSHALLNFFNLFYSIIALSSWILSFLLWKTGKVLSSVIPHFYEVFSSTVVQEDSKYWYYLKSSDVLKSQRWCIKKKKKRSLELLINLSLIWIWGAKNSLSEVQHEIIELHAKTHEKMCFTDICEHQGIQLERIFIAN